MAAQGSAPPAGQLGGRWVVLQRELRTQRGLVMPAGSRWWVASVYLGLSLAPGPGHRSVATRVPVEVVQFEDETPAVPQQASLAGPPRPQQLGLFDGQEAIGEGNTEG